MQYAFVGGLPKSICRRERGVSGLVRPGVAFPGFPIRWSVYLLVWNFNRGSHGRRWLDCSWSHNVRRHSLVPCSLARYSRKAGVGPWQWLFIMELGCCWWLVGRQLGELDFFAGISSLPGARVTRRSTWNLGICGG